MRLGVISDIHGNLFALDTVLAAIDHHGVDQTVCLGDLAVLGPEPGAVIDRLRDRRIACVSGNTDSWAVADHPLPALAPKSAPAVDLTAWTSSRLSLDQSLPAVFAASTRLRRGRNQYFVSTQRRIPLMT